MDKVERVARAICTARGKDPDQESGQGPMEARTLAQNSMQASYTYGPRPMPNWQLFEAEAKAFVAAHEALTNGTEA